MRLMGSFVNIEGVDRILFAIFNKFNEQWRGHARRVFTQAALLDITCTKVKLITNDLKKIRLLEEGSIVVAERVSLK